MSTSESAPEVNDLDHVKANVPPKGTGLAEGINIRNMTFESPEQRVDAIEMIGEESAAGLAPGEPSQITAGMRYLHCSRTIHQLVTDRNRAVGLYLAVATLLWTASTALLNAEPNANLIIPLGMIQKWALPLTFGIMTMLALLVALLLVRTRVGLIYEVAKMNVLLGLPVGRVKRVNPLSIFFIMHVIISLAGGLSGAFFSQHLLALAGIEPQAAIWPAALIGVVVVAGLVVLYIVTVLHTTSDKKLQGDLKQ